MHAYIFIDSLPERAHIIVAELLRRRDVMLADVINGPHSVAAVLNGVDAASLAKSVVFEIRTIEGVKDVTVYAATDTEG